MIKINGKVYEGNSLLINKNGDVIIDGVLQGSIEQKIKPNNNIRASFGIIMIVASVVLMLSIWILN